MEDHDQIIHLLKDIKFFVMVIWIQILVVWLLVLAV